MSEFIECPFCGSEECETVSWGAGFETLQCIDCGEFFDEELPSNLDDPRDEGDADWDE